MMAQHPAETPDTAAAGDRPVLTLWAESRNGIRSVARTLCGVLEGPPHGLPVVWVDLPEAMQAGPLVKQVASAVGRRLEVTVVAAMGWAAVEQRLGDRAPGVVVAMDPVAAAAVDSWRSKGRLRAPLVGLVSSLWLDPAWAQTAVDRLCVADEIVARSGLELGLPAECLVPCGVPVCGGFSGPSSEERGALRRRFGLAADTPLVLVVTDGLDPDQLTGALFQLSLVAERAQLLFDVDRDAEAADLLRRRASLYGVRARMFGKVEEAGQLWAAADVVVAQPHLYVEQRVVAQRLPLVAIFPEGEAQRQRARIHDQRGIGRHVQSLATLAAEIEAQLAPRALEQARQRLAAISKRVAVQDAARLVAQVRAQADQILAESRAQSEARSRAGAGGGGASAAPPAAADRQGPLEDIGLPAELQARSEPGPRLSPEDLLEAEAEAGRQVLQHQEEAERWGHRADLARAKADAELQRTAQQMVDRHLAAMHRALADLARLAEQRAALEEREVRGRRLEHTFRQLEVEDALADLKRKLGGGPG